MTAATAPDPTSVDRHGHDRAVSIVIWLVAVVTIGTLITALVALPAVLDSKAGIEAQNRSDKVTACRGEYRADIDTAQQSKDEAESHRIDAISDILLTSIAKDRAALLRASDRLARSKLEVELARQAVAKATSANRAAVKLSGSHPAAFLRQCQRRS